jgi:hypothetical protein
VGRRRRVWEAGSQERRHTWRQDGRAAVLGTRASTQHGGFVMEALLIPGLLILLAFLATCFGEDSREHVVSAEETLARRGFTWRADRP